MCDYIGARPRAFCPHPTQIPLVSRTRIAFFLQYSDGFTAFADRLTFESIKQTDRAKKTFVSENDSCCPIVYGAVLDSLSRSNRYFQVSVGNRRIHYVHYTVYILKNDYRNLKVLQYYSDIRYTKFDPVRSTTLRLPFQMRNGAYKQSHKVHFLRTRCIKAFLPHGKVKAGSIRSTKVGVSQTLVEEETGTRADDLIFGVRATRNE